MGGGQDFLWECLRISREGLVVLKTISNKSLYFSVYVFNNTNYRKFNDILLADENLGFQTVNKSISSTLV